MKTIPLTQGKASIVDDEDYDRLSQFRWTYHNRGYACMRTSTGMLLMHQLVIDIKQDEETDHINGNKLDNRKENLRSVPHHFNMLNWKRTKKKCGLEKGVYICGSGRFVASIMWKGKRDHIGTFDTEQEAAVAYRKELERRIKETYGESINVTSELPNRQSSPGFTTTNCGG